MYKIAFWVMLACIYQQAAACDVCGGAASGSYLGILPQYRKHFIGFTYQSQSFTSTHPLIDGEAANVQSHDLFRSVTAWGRFYPHRRVQLFAFVPYQYNQVTEQGHTTVMNGIGDIRVLVNYVVINKTGEDRKLQHSLLAGVGLKAPTGKNSFTNSEGIILSNMQPGTGSWDVIANTNYTLRYQQLGVNSDVSYQLATPNKRDYLYGDKLNAGLSFFYWKEWGAVSLLPQVGGRLQHSGVDRSSNTYNIRNPYSGGTQLYASAGAGAYWKKLALTALGHIPVYEHYADGLVNSHFRYELQFQYLF